MSRISNIASEGIIRKKRTGGGRKRKERISGIKKSVRDTGFRGLRDKGGGRNKVCAPPSAQHQQVLPQV